MWKADAVAGADMAILRTLRTITDMADKGMSGREEKECIRL